MRSPALRHALILFAKCTKGKGRNYLSLHVAVCAVLQTRTEIKSFDVKINKKLFIIENSDWHCLLFYLSTIPKNLPKILWPLLWPLRNRSHCLVSTYRKWISQLQLELNNLEIPNIDWKQLPDCYNCSSPRIFNMYSF